MAVDRDAGGRKAGAVHAAGRLVTRLVAADVERRAQRTERRLVDPAREVEALDHGFALPAQVSRQARELELGAAGRRQRELRLHEQAREIAARAQHAADLAAFGRGPRGNALETERLAREHAAARARDRPGAGVGARFFELDLAARHGRGTGDVA